MANISIVTQSRVVFRYFSCTNLTFLRSTGVLCQSWFLESGNRTTETNSNYFRGKWIYGETLWSSQNEQETGKLLQEWVSPEDQGKGSSWNCQSGRHHHYSLHVCLSKPSYQALDLITSSILDVPKQGVWLAQNDPQSPPGRIREEKRQESSPFYKNRASPQDCLQWWRYNSLKVGGKYFKK